MENKFEIMALLLNNGVREWNPNIPMKLEDSSKGYKLSKEYKYLTIDKTKYTLRVSSIPPDVMIRMRKHMQPIWDKYRKKYPEEHFYSRLYHMGKITFEDFHYACGKSNGYPECCIRNYIHIICEKHSPPALYMTAMYGTPKRKTEYVQCAECIKK